MIAGENMSITVRTRKALWARSGNCCAICRTELVSLELKEVPGVIIGEECHIISSKRTGPRGNEPFEGDFDEYDNLVLLCANDHSRIDAVTTFFPATRLRLIKREHEQWVRATLRKDVTAFSNDQFRIESLARIETGRQLFELFSDSHAYQFDYPELESQTVMEAVSGLFQTMQDYGDISSEIEVSDRIRIGFELTEEIKELEELGLVLFGSRREMKIRVRFEEETKPPMDWFIATLVAVRPDNPSIFGDFMIAGFPKKTSL